MTWKLELNGGKLTQRDQKLLVFLLVVTILAIAGWMIIRPLVVQIREDADEIAVQEELKIVNDNKITVLPSQRTITQTNRENYAQAVAEYFPWMESNEIGKYLTNMALDYGLNALSMVIQMPADAKYVPDFVGAPVQEEDADSMLPVLYTANVSFKTQGDEQIQQKLLDHLIREEDSLLVTGFSWDEQAYYQDGTLVTMKTLQIQIRIFMTKD